MTLLLLCGGSGTAPSAQQPGSQTVAVPGGTSPSPFGQDLPPGQREKQEIARNEARQKQLVADTDKLLQLATSLHEDVAKTDKHILSVEVIKRADEIEKLAHAVKEKMRG